MTLSPADEERRLDGGRDAFALLAACLAHDDEGVRAVLANCDGLALVMALGSMVLNLLQDAGTDAAVWVADMQASLHGTG